MRSIENEFYRRPEWKKCRKAYLQFVSGRCERCLKKGLHVPAEIVHHKIYLTEENVNDPAMAYGFDNLEALCRDCHNEEHFRDRPRWKIVGGRVVAR